MPGLDTYLSFNGNCADAMRFYEKTLGGKIEFMMTHGESPMADQTPPEFKNQIMHSTLKLGDRRLQAADAPPGAPKESMSGFSLSLTYPTVSEGETIFNALGSGGEVRMPLQETFWVERFGIVADKFGTPWMVSAGNAKMG